MAKRKALETQVPDIAEDVLERHGKVTAFDVLECLRWLYSVHVQSWKQRLQPESSLEHWMQSTRKKRTRVLKLFEQWGDGKALEKTAVTFYPHGRQPREELQVTADGDRELERLFRLCFIKPDLSEKKRANLEKKLKKKPDLLVFETFREDTCTECNAVILKGDLVFLEGHATLCLGCADLDRLEFLPSGNVALTRRARKYSALSAIVLRHNRRFRRQQRIGLLVTPKGLERAEKECLADADGRAEKRRQSARRRIAEDKELIRDMQEKILEMYPGCPPEEARNIAAHTGLRGSGRVGRSAAGRDLDPRALDLAVRAHIRHNHTNYDRRLLETGDREGARRTIQPQLDAVIEKWASE